jgi:DNA-binding NarL/FixJ family response regulator
VGIVTVLLERERELAEIDALLAEVVAGNGRAVAIEAGAGLGKTRLLQEARRAAASRGLSVLSARATELERDFTFALVRQLFEARLAALAAGEREQVLEGASAAKSALGLEPGDGESPDSFSVLHGLYWVTAALAERGPLLIEIDDAHWADASSLDYLRFMLPRLEELPVLLVIAARPDEPDLRDGLRRILTDPSQLHLTPAPLSEEAAAALLSQELGREPESRFAAVCHEQSGGNPFLLGELSRALGEREIEPHAAHAELVRELAPERVAHWVMLRIQRLSASAGAVARALTVLGDGSELRLVAALADLALSAAGDAADELRGSAILDEETSLRFVHPLVRNAVYAEVPAGERARAHARAAELLRESGASPERIAGQLLAGEANGERATVKTLLEAGERALATGSPSSAIAYLTRALEEPPPADLRPTVLDPLLTATYRAADLATFAAIEPDVRAEMERDPSLRSRWAFQMMMSMGMGGRFEEAAALIEEAVEAAAARGEMERAFQLEAQLRTIALLGPSVRKVDLDGYAERIDPESAAGRLAAAMEVRSLVVNGTAKEAADAAKRALGNNGAIFAEESEIAAAVTSVLTLVICDEIDAARQAAERALAIAGENGAATSLMRARFVSGFVAWGAGDLVTAEAELRQALDLARLTEIVPLAILFIAAVVEILVERDELEAAEAELQTIGMAAAPTPENVIFNALLLTRGHLRVEQGQFEGAAEDFATFSNRLKVLGIGAQGIPWGVPWAVRALVAVGEQAQARQYADGMLIAARKWGAPASVAQVLRAVAIGRGGREGIGALEEAAALMEKSPRPLERAHVLADLGEALRREGRRAEAREPLQEAFELARRCGAARLAKRANAELQATGAKVRRYTPIGVESLTPSERRVTDLAASGMTNRQIAQSLFVTVKTVEAHLSAAYSKLDIGSRRELEGALESGSSEVP